MDEFGADIQIIINGSKCKVYATKAVQEKKFELDLLLEQIKDNPMSHPSINYSGVCKTIIKTKDDLAKHAQSHATEQCTDCGQKYLIEYIININININN